MALVKTARGRVVFEDDNEDNARAYVEQHFPHIHVEPGSGYDGDPTADVVLIDNDGDHHALVGGEWLDVDYVTNEGRFEHKQAPPAAKPAKAATTGKEK